MKIEPINSIDPIKKLLAKADLPNEDISHSASMSFYGVFDDSLLLAVVGLERYGKVGLLRSLAVDPSHQNKNTGKSLVRYVEETSIEKGVERLCLLTTTAETYFQKMGYTSASRDDAPAAIRATSQFSGLCPDSAAFMAKELTKQN